MAYAMVTPSRNSQMAAECSYLVVVPVFFVNIALYGSYRTASCEDVTMELSIRPSLLEKNSPQNLITYMYFIHYV